MAEHAEDLENAWNSGVERSWPNEPAQVRLNGPVVAATGAKLSVTCGERT